MNQNFTHSEIIAKEKAVLRDEVLQRRAGLDVKVRSELSQRATLHFLESVSIPEHAIVALYWPIREELDCRALIKELQSRGHQTCLPVVMGPEFPLEFRIWDGQSDLQSAAFGTMVPGESAEIVTPEVMVMPLAGFDSSGNRLGYGKGFYDRTIASYGKKPLLVGLAFTAQALKQVPASPHDVPLDMMVTEDGALKFAPKPNIF